MQTTLKQKGHDAVVYNGVHFLLIVFISRVTGLTLPSNELAAAWLFDWEMRPILTAFIETGILQEQHLYVDLSYCFQSRRTLTL